MSQDSLLPHRNHQSVLLCFGFLRFNPETIIALFSCLVNHFDMCFSFIFWVYQIGTPLDIPGYKC